MKPRSAFHSVFGLNVYQVITLSTAFHFYTGFTLEMSDNYINKVDWRFGMIQYLMLRFSECLNPIFYNAASQ